MSPHLEVALEFLRRKDWANLNIELSSLTSDEKDYLHKMMEIEESLEWDSWLKGQQEPLPADSYLEESNYEGTSK